MADIPLIRNFDADAVFAHRDRRPIRVEEFLGEVRRLADLLPDRQYVVNLCSDRYQFSVGFAAALLRHQVNLLPPNATPDLLKRLSLEYPGVYCLSDAPVGLPAFEVFPYPQMEVSQVTAAVPQFPPAQVAAVLFTSGSTGQPVPHPKSWGSLVRSGLAEIESLGLEAYRHMRCWALYPNNTVTASSPPF